MKKRSEEDIKRDAEIQEIADKAYEHWRRNYSHLKGNWHMDPRDVSLKALELAISIYSLYSPEERREIKDELKAAGQDPVTGFFTLHAPKFEQYIKEGK